MKRFFKATNDAALQFTALFDFSWAAIPALWNLRWQVAGFLREVPAATDADLRARFVLGSEVHGANLKAACVDIAWDEQKSQFASIMLTNAFSIYEHWADEIMRELNVSNVTGKSLQFPDGASGLGYLSAIRSITQKTSKTLDAAYYPIYSTDVKYALPHADSLLRCFRYYKEARNSQIHNGGRATERAARASSAFAPVSSRHDLGMKGSLEFDPLSKGQAVKLRLRGVVGFCDVLIRLMMTADAELCRAHNAEVSFEARLRVASQAYKPLPAEPSRRLTKIRKICRAAGYPTPHDAAAVSDFMLKKRIP